MVQAAQIAAAASMEANSFPLPSPPTSMTNDMELQHLLTPLPRQRTKLLPPAKESRSRAWLDRKMANISRRFLRKYGESVSAADEPTTTRPYQNIGEMCHTLDEVVNFLWTTATPAIEVPYMLEMADDFIKYATSFPPLPRPTFQLLHKLDICFASMLVGNNLITTDPLPTKPFLTVTDMVRLKGIVERTRLEIIPLFGGFEFDDDDEETIMINGLDQDVDLEDFKSYTSYEDDEYDDLYRPCQTPCAQASMQAQMTTPGQSTADEDSDFEPEDDILAGVVPRPSRRQSVSQSTEIDRPPRRWDEDEEDDFLGFEIGRAYEKTIMQLGKTLGVGMFP